MRIKLAEVTEQDLAVFYQHQQDPEACKMADFPSRERQAFFEHWRTKVLGSELAVARSIWIKSDSPELGETSFKQGGSPERDASPEQVSKSEVLPHWQLVGNIVSWQVPIEVGSPMIAGQKLQLASEHYTGYWIGREFWGKGIATRALNTFLHQHSPRPLLAWVAEHNTGSIKVLERNGFKQIDPIDFGFEAEQGMLLLMLEAES
ncbi:N-acetyltransferase [Shewanella maritima]|uniref:N-acetyltransferase n=1 Tax=Shewanella maritima TaxID=2520507 RepID=A0A411PG02_9GAMM|nr:GNAT family N-acetyltransferase [Shewanella maritima]QBF82481.1 N-acetyltransferase [Shewanella maritima]